MTPSGARQRYHTVIADWLAFKDNIISHEEYLAMLALHRPPNPPQLVRSFITQRPIGLNLSAQGRQHGRRIPLPHRPRKLGNGGRRVGN